MNMCPPQLLSLLRHWVSLHLAVSVIFLLFKNGIAIFITMPNLYVLRLNTDIYSYYELYYSFSTLLSTLKAQSHLLSDVI